MLDDAIATRIMEMLTRSYPSGLTVKDILRTLKHEGAMKAAINRVLYTGFGQKGLARKDDSTPPCWTATEALLQQSSSKHHKPTNQAKNSGQVHQPAHSAPTFAEIHPVPVDTQQSVRTQQSPGTEHIQVSNYQYAPNTVENMPLQGSSQTSGFSLQGAGTLHEGTQIVPAVGIFQPIQPVQFTNPVVACPADIRCQACGAEQPVHMCVNGSFAASYQPVATIFNYPVSVVGVAYGSGDNNQMAPAVTSSTQDPNRQGNVHVNASENSQGAVHAIEGLTYNKGTAEAPVQAPQTQIIQTSNEFGLLGTTYPVAQNLVSSDLLHSFQAHGVNGCQKQVSDEDLNSSDFSENLSTAVRSGPDIVIHRDHRQQISLSSEISDDPQDCSLREEIPGISTPTKLKKDVSGVSREYAKQKPLPSTSSPTSDPIVNSWFNTTDEVPFFG